MHSNNNNKPLRATTPAHLPNPPTPNNHDSPTPSKHSATNAVHKCLTSSKVTKLAINTDQANAALNVETGQLKEHRQLYYSKDKIHWTCSFSNELRYLV